jgi:electron transfer flavoprotein beta subunit
MPRQGRGPRGAHLGRAVEGSDPIAIARILAAVTRREAPDLLFAGVQSSDQAFAATGIATQACSAGRMPPSSPSLASRRAQRPRVFRRELEGGLLHEVEIQVPAVLTIQLGINTPRYASLRSIKQAAAKPIEVFGLADLGLTAATSVRRDPCRECGACTCPKGDARN